MEYRAVIKQSGNWWIGWLIDLPGVNAQEKTREELIKSLKVGAEDLLNTSFEPQDKEELVRIEVWNSFEAQPLLPTLHHPPIYLIAAPTRFLSSHAPVVGIDIHPRAPHETDERNPQFFSEFDTGTGRRRFGNE